MTDERAPKLRQPISGLAAKIILFVFCSTLLTALVGGWVAVGSTRTFLWRALEERLPGVLEHAGDDVARRVSLARTHLDAAPTPAAGTTTATAQALLTGLLAGGREFEATGWSAPSGALLASVGEPMPDPLPSALLAVEGTAAVVVPTPGGARLALVRATPAGRLVALLSPRVLEDALGDARAASGLDLILVGGGGVALARADAAAVASEGTRTGAEAMPPDGGGARVWTDARGRRFVGASRTIDGLGVVLVARQPFSDAFAPAFGVVTHVFAVNLGIVLLFSFLAYRVTSAMVQPIEALSVGARQISQGQLDVEVPEPRSNDEIGLLTRTFNDMTRRLRKNQVEIQAVNHQLLTQNQDLQRANEVLAQLSITDGLTKLHNHRFFQDHLTRELKRVNRTGEPLAMLLVDIDDFKRLNDRLGHAAGDELLVRIAAVMNRCIRESDLLARYGGEEFVIVAGGTDVAGAIHLAEKVRAGVADSSFILDDSLRPTRVTISIGVAQYKGDRKAFFQSADRALYRAKAEGKNCVRADEGA